MIIEVEPQAIGVRSKRQESRLEPLARGSRAEESALRREGYGLRVREALGASRSEAKGSRTWNKKSAGTNQETRNQHAGTRSQKPKTRQKDTCLTEKFAGHWKSLYL